MAEREARRRFVTALVNGASLKIISYKDIIANDGIAIFRCCEAGDNKSQVEIHCEVTIFGFDVCECRVCGKKWAILTDFEMSRDTGEEKGENNYGS